MVNYVVAIPTYNRQDVLENKTLKTLIDGGVSKNKIYLFVANQEQCRLYEESIPKNMYKEIIIGKKGIANQRNFIANYFDEGQYVVSMDDDVEEFQMLRGEKLAKLKNPFFMYNEITMDSRFLIGVTYGFIVRHNRNLRPSIKSETKEDYEQTILYYKMDGGVMRFNYITTKTKFNAPGGLGTDRYERNKNAATYLFKKYPDIVTVFQRKNGTYEVKLKRLPYQH